MSRSHVGQASATQNRFTQSKLASAPASCPCPQHRATTPGGHVHRPRRPTAVWSPSRLGSPGSNHGSGRQALPLGLRGSHRAKSASRSIWLYGWSKSLDLGKEKLIINRVMCYAAGQLE